MNKQQATHLLHEIFDDLLNPTYIDKISSLYHSDVVADMGGEIAYFKDIVNRAQFRLNHFIDMNTEFEDILADGDKIAVRVKQKAQHKNGTHSFFNCFLIYQIVDNKVAKVWGAFSPNFNYLEKA